MVQRKPRSSTTGRATMNDVAILADVGTITVSRAFRTPDAVKPVLRERIFAAAKTLGYAPNRAASALASSRSMNVAVLVPSMTNTVFVDTLAAIHEILQPAGYQTLIGVTRYSNVEEERLLDNFLQFLPDGVLITGNEHSDTTLNTLNKMTTPIVQMMELTQTDDAFSAGFSQFEAGRAIARHLIDRGYRRIGIVGAQLDPRTLARIAGCRAELQDAGLYNVARELLDPVQSSIGAGAQLFDELLAKAPDCDAIFFINDDLAQGALFQAQRRGIAVPGSIAIAGFNDLPASAWTSPPLTTIATPRYEIGKEAAKMLLDLMRGKNPAQPRIDLGFSLVAREST